MSWFTDLLKDRYTSGGDLDLGNIAKDVGVAGALYGIVNPNDSSGLASFFGTGGRQQPVGYTGGIPNYTATRELVPNAFAQTYTTPTGEVAPRRPGGAGRRYFTDTTFTQSTGTPFMGITAEQIAAQNQAAQDELDFFNTLMGSAAAQREAAGQATDTTTDTTTDPTTDTTDTPLTGDAAYNSFVDSLRNREFTNEQGIALARDIASRGYRLRDVANSLGIRYVDLPEEVIEAFIAYDPENGGGTTFVDDTTTDTSTNGAGANNNANNANNANNVDDTDTDQTIRQLYEELLSTQVDAAGGRFDRDEQRVIADSIINNAFGIGDIAQRYNVQPVDVIEGLLRGEFQTPEQIAAMSSEIDEPKLIAFLLEQGKTTPEEVAAYYKDHPVYGGITPEQVVQAFRGMGGEREFAQGGMAQGRGYYLGGTTDGMADQIPATINNMEPARLSDGEFVIPADVVSHLGNGNSDAGAKNLYSMMERVRKDRTGNPKQGKQIDPNKYLA